MAAVTKKKKKGVAVRGKTKASAASPSRFATQADAEAFLRTNPERSTLAQQLADARGDRDSSIAASNTAADANVAAARRAPAEYQRVHDDAAARVKAAVDVPGVDNPTTGAGRDAAQTRGQLATMLASAQDDAKARELGAQQGRQYAVNQAEGGYQKSAGTIASRLRALAEEQGVFTQGRVAELSGESSKASATAREKAADRKNSRLVAGVNDDGTVTPNGPKDPKAKNKGKGVKPASPDFLKGLRSSASTGKGAAADLKAANFSRADADKLLASGQKGSSGQDVYRTVDTPSGGTKQEKVLEKDGTAKQGGAVPDIPQIADPLARSVALDIAFDGGISRANVRKLIAAGVAPGQFAAALGAKTQLQRGKGRLTKPKAPKFRDPVSDRNSN